MKQLYIYCEGGFGRRVMDMLRRLDSAAARRDEILFLDRICTAAFLHRAAKVESPRPVKRRGRRFARQIPKFRHGGQSNSTLMIQTGPGPIRFKKAFRLRGEFDPLQSPCTSLQTAELEQRVSRK